MNKLTIIGNLTRDPESRTVQTANGEATCCNFSVAVNNRKGDADFFRVTVWRGLAENCAKYLVKGRKVAVTGSVSLHMYNAADGTTKGTMEVHGEDVEFLTPKAEGQPAAAPEPAPAPKPEQYQQVDAGDDLPF